jgi:MFS family permease
MTLLYLPQALTPNIAMMIAFRAIQGIFASSGNSLVGGFVADVFKAENRGFPMSFFTLLVFCAIALGGITFAWIDVALGWRWIQWISMIINGIWMVLTYFFLEETRGSFHLGLRADTLTKETGRLHVPRSAQSAVLPVRDQIKLAAGRAIKLLFTEPIVFIYSAYISLLWGMVFLFFNSAPYVFSQYGFSNGAKGTVFVANIVGAIGGAIMCHYTDKLYTRDRRRSPTGRAPPESRLYPCCIGAVVTPLAILAFSWTGQPHIHWIAPTIFLGLFNFGVYGVYLCRQETRSASFKGYLTISLASPTWQIAMRFGRVAQWRRRAVR